MRTKDKQAAEDLRSAREYWKKAADKHATGKATEHTYRSALEDWLAAMVGCKPINEPQHIECGAPDLRLEDKSGATIGYVETKDVGVNLAEAEKSAQMSRYREGLGNLILTDYLHFRHYVNGELRECATVSESLASAKARPNKAQAEAMRRFFDKFKFAAEAAKGENPTPEQLAKIMAGKTRMLRDIVMERLEKESSPELESLRESFKKFLKFNIGRTDFAGVFSQTAVYGLFAARLEAEKQGGVRGFNRNSAGALLPQTTPFLRKFFNQFVGSHDLDNNVARMVDDITRYFASIEMEAVLKSFGSGGRAEDPFLHFYETFLRHYDPKTKTLRGVFFTPSEVVDFIVRAADYALREYLDIHGGLADDSRLDDGRHLVQILDPATGTGAFPVKTLEHIRADVIQKHGEAVWPSYAVEHLLPRLYGFEYMMSAYAMCHIKFALALGGDVMKKLAEGDGRVNVYMTDALSGVEDKGNGFVAAWLEAELKAADIIKGKTPVMVVMGNPPYSVHTTKDSNYWTSQLLGDYKEGLGERHINLDDDYIKFIRNAEYFIEKNKRGIVAMITNNSFYDGVTHRQMRRHLMSTFDRIHILNLHGNARLHEQAPDGGKDENVFDIRQGVGIFIMAKTGLPGGGVFYHDLYGGRKEKFDFLLRESVSSIKWRELSPQAPYYFFTPKDFSSLEEYEKGVKLTDLFGNYTSGIQTKCDEISIHFERQGIEAAVDAFRTLTIKELKAKWPNKTDSAGWAFGKAQDALKNNVHTYENIYYRPFDTRHTVYATFSGGFIARPRHNTHKHIVGHDNVGLIAPRLCKGKAGFEHGFVSKNIVDIGSGDAYSGAGTFFFPLWIYPDAKEQGALGDNESPKRKANFNAESVALFAKKSGLEYAETGKGEGTFSPEDLLHYVLAAMHHPEYRSKFAEMLKIDFARIPLPNGKEHFCEMAKAGRSLRQVLLLEDPDLDKAEVKFAIEGGDKVDKAKVRAEPIPEGKNQVRVFINKTQYFDNVPKSVWEQSVGGYFPAQKWLKDRHNRELKFDDKRHYCRIVAALAKAAQIAAKMPPLSGE